MEIIPTPHDRLFKAVWSDIESVKGFIKQYLSADILEAADLNHLEIMKDSFVEEELQEYFSDMLYKVSVDGKDGYIYFLFEHKSFPDAGVPFQLLQYLVNIWRLSQKQKVNPLPVIVPIVIYHGQKEWGRTADFAHLFGEIRDCFEIYIPNFSFILFDLSRYSDDEIRGTLLMQTTLLLFKYVKHADFIDKLPSIILLLNELSQKRTAKQYIEAVIRYIVLN